MSWHLCIGKGAVPGMLAALLGEIHMTLPPHLGLAQWWPDFTGVVHGMAQSLQIDPEGKLCATARPYVDQVNQFDPRLDI